MKCPLCKLENPEIARTCDCGYSFATGSAPSVASLDTVLLRSIDRSLRTIKLIVVSWAVLTAIGFIVSIVQKYDPVISAERRAKEATR